MRILREGEVGKGLLIEEDGYYDRARKENLKIIKEAVEDTENFLKNPYLYCVLQKYDIENKNRRIYPKSVLTASIDKYMSSVQNRSSIGSVDHDDNENVSLLAHRVGLLIEDIFWDGPTCMGKVLLPISKGFANMGIISCGADGIANLIFYHNILVGISSRGLGEVESKNSKKYVTDYELLCWDWVQMPSTHGAWAFMDKEGMEPHIDKQVKGGVEKPEALKNTWEKLADYMNTSF
jgi:hypothetical protein